MTTFTYSSIFLYVYVRSSYVYRDYMWGGQGVCMSICTRSYRSQRSISDVVPQVLPTCVYGVRGSSYWPEAHYVG